MSISRKVFIGVFSTSVLVCTALIWMAYQIVGKQTENAYRERYARLSRALGRTLSELDQKTETLLLNAAHVVAREDAKRGVLSTSELSALREEVNVTHAFVIDKAGRFVRSTNEDPRLIPNLFSFCGEYRHFLGGSKKALSTPIIPPTPEPKPYKFLFVPNHDRTRILEVGMRVDFIGSTLSGAVKDDPNVTALNLYAPDGTDLGSFGREGAVYRQEKARLPDDLDKVVVSKSDLRVFVKVEATQPRCCQCDVAGISKNGEYYYVLEAVISKTELNETLASLWWLFLALEGVAVLVALFAGKWIAVRLVGRVEWVKEKVRAMARAGDHGARIALSGNDEIAFLANEFDGLLERLEKSQAELLDSQRKAALGEQAGQVAHNVATPVRALEMMLPTLKDLPDRHRRVIRNAVKEIRDMVRTLKVQSTSGMPILLDQGKAISVIESGRMGVELLSELIEAALAEIRVHFKSRRAVEIGFELSAEGYGLFANVEGTDFKSIIANLVKNGVEALGREGTVSVVLRQDQGRAVIEVHDDGKGIPEEILARLGERGATFGKPNGTGIGLYHAKTTVQRWGGELSVVSRVGEGTRVRIALPIAKPPSWFVPAIEIAPRRPVVIIDDDELVHQMWRARFGEEEVDVEVVSCMNGKELRRWISATPAHSDAIYLVDFELAASGENGLRIIEGLGIGERSILVSDHFGEPAVMARAQWLGVRVLPKNLVSCVPICCRLSSANRSEGRSQASMA